MSRGLSHVFRACAPVVLLAVAGCSPSGERSPEASSEKPLRVAVSLPPQGWLVEAIGGERVEAISLVGPGDSPETYQPSDAQVSRALAAPVYFRVGAPFENGAWFGSLAAAPLEVVDLRRGIELLSMEEGHAHGSGASGASGLDPHVWVSPRRLAVQAATVAETLAGLDADHADLYQARLEATLAELDALDRDLEGILEPVKGRAFFVFHPAWGYLADDYGLEQVAIEIEGKSPDDAALTRLQRRAREAGVTTIFVQPQTSPRAAEAVAGAIGGRVVSLDPLAADVPENLRRVAREIARSLDGKAGSPGS